MMLYYYNITTWNNSKIFTDLVVSRGYELVSEEIITISLLLSYISRLHELFKSLWWINLRYSEILLDKHKV